MIRLLAALLLPLVLFAGETVRIATYNVENLFDLERSGHEYAEYIPNTPWQWNEKTYRKKLRNIARVIAEIKPDVIGLQEVESDQALRDLQVEIKRAGLYLPHRAIADAKPSVVKTALLSRFPVKVKREIAVANGNRIRNILEARLDTGGEPFYVFVNHWKSKSGPESLRILSAKALKSRLDALGSVSYVLLGDFNSDYDEKHLFMRKRKHNDTDGITGINDVLLTMRGEKGVTLDDLHRCPKCAYDLWYDLPGLQRWSHSFYGQQEALDHIIISPALADGKGNEYVKGSFTRFRPDYLLTKKGAPYRWQRSRTYPKHHTGKGYSDHLPIYADFTLK
ncbi:endonuclease/exonuclease/phosphatase family protein [Sulfurimonas sp. HSL-1656]|uniref:endonuclease/exonuclease/phosphatase family protein n=1 Tax=Thiomicrolovo subterrani TaxID=3131934 RepID=UPI0031F83ECE